MKRLIILCIGIVLYSSCTFLPKIIQTEDLLARETDVPGWVVTKQDIVTSHEAIARYNETYSEYDPVELVAVDYSYLSDKTKSIHAEVIKFKTPLDSFGLYSRDRGFDNTGRFTDDNNYSSNKGIFLRAGTLYAKICGENTVAHENPALEQFEAVIRQNCIKHGGGEMLPRDMFLFSDKHDSRDIIYYKKGLPFIPGSKELFVMRRTIEAKKYDIVYSRMSTSYDAERVFHNILKNGGNAFILTRLGSIQPAIRIMSDKEYLFISYYKKWIFGVLNAENMNEGNRIIIILFSEVKLLLDKKGSDKPIS